MYFMLVIYMYTAYDLGFLLYYVHGVWAILWYNHAVSGDGHMLNRICVCRCVSSMISSVLCAWGMMKAVSDRNSNLSIDENTFENIVCEMSAFFSRPQCVNQYYICDRTVGSDQYSVCWWIGSKVLNRWQTQHTVFFYSMLTFAIYMV